MTLYLISHDVRGVFLGIPLSFVSISNISLYLSSLRYIIVPKQVLDKAAALKSMET